MLLSGLSRTNGQSVSVGASRRPSLYTLMLPVSHLTRRERSRTLLLTLKRKISLRFKELIEEKGPLARLSEYIAT